MSAGFVFERCFAGAVVLSAAALVAAALERLPRLVLGALAGVVAAASAAAWAAFGLHPSTRLAVDGAGLAACAVVILTGIPLAAAVARSRRVEAEFERAERGLDALVEREAEVRAAELERTLARARADSSSRLAEEERRIADERRAAIVEREERAGEELAAALAGAQRRVEQRL